MSIKDITENTLANWRSINAHNTEHMWDAADNVTEQHQESDWLHEVNIYQPRQGLIACNLGFGKF